MIALIRLLVALLASSLRSKVSLEAENAALRLQLIVLQRKLRGRIRLSNGDRLFFVWLYRLFPSILRAILIVRPDSLVRWHRAGFRRYWRWKSRLRVGRPPVERELRALIRQMSAENPLWGAPRIHGELLKLGFAVAQSTVAKYIPNGLGHVRRPGGRSCAITRPTSPRLIYSLCQRSALVFFTGWSLSAWRDVGSYGSTSRPIRPPSGSLDN
ncbi:MAG: helix-turn-helix domain-containing protein [Deltaproteobacteria bacterium]|nr:helix-turn-helix domain-containing protein [Deltaproteobacteria bacterium]